MRFHTWARRWVILCPGWDQGLVCFSCSMQLLQWLSPLHLGGFVGWERPTYHRFWVLSPVCLPWWCPRNQGLLLPTAAWMPILKNLVWLGDYHMSPTLAKQIHQVPHHLTSATLAKQWHHQSPHFSHPSQMSATSMAVSLLLHRHLTPGCQYISIYNFSFVYMFAYSIYSLLISRYIFITLPAIPSPTLLFIYHITLINSLFLNLFYSWFLIFFSSSFISLSLSLFFSFAPESPTHGLSIDTHRWASLRGWVDVAVPGFLGLRVGFHVHNTA